MNDDNKKDPFVEVGHELTDKVEDSFIDFLHMIIRMAVKVLATLMVLVIVWGIGDVIYVLYQRLISPRITSYNVCYTKLLRKNH